MKIKLFQGPATFIALALATPLAAQPGSDQIDPARLASARTTVDYIFPAGTYGKMMDGTLQSVMAPIMNSAGQMSLQQIAAATGMKSEEVSKLGKTTIADVMKIMDPAYQERMNATMGAMMPAMAKIMTDFEPSMRDGLTRAYARHFDKAQLDDMNRFFATPAGSAYASNAMLIQLDPEVMTRMSDAMPKLMQRLLGEMPTIMKDVEAKTAGMPKARKYEDLTPAERSRLSALLGISDTNPKKPAK